MRTSLIIDDALMERLIEAGGFRTRSEAIVTAVREYVERIERNRLAELRGRIEFEEGHLSRLGDLEREELG